jgi:hypothetical protein
MHLATRLLLGLLLGLVWAGQAAAEDASRRLALFPVELIILGAEAADAAELARLDLVHGLLVEHLEPHGVVAIDTSRADGKIASYASLTGCNGCEIGLAAELGADIAGVAWVQKVSNLILNINLKLTDVKTGRLLKLGSVDIRGNTDETWSRGAVYLIKRRLFVEQ